jgi:hypothetical protein
MSSTETRVRAHSDCPQPSPALDIGDRRKDRIRCGGGFPVEVQFRAAVAVCQAGIIAARSEHVDFPLGGLAVKAHRELVDHHYAIASATSFFG